MLTVLFVIGAVVLYLLIGGLAAGFSVGVGLIKTEPGMVFSALLWPLWLPVVSVCYIAAFAVGIGFCAWALGIKFRERGDNK